MKTRLYIIIGMIISIIISVTLTELFNQMNLCEISSQFYDNIPEMNMFECLQFLSSPDPYYPHGEPTICSDYTYNFLSMIETIVIVGVAASLIIFTMKKKKTKIILLVIVAILVAILPWFPLLISMR